MNFPSAWDNEMFSSKAPVVFLLALIPVVLFFADRQQEAIQGEHFASLCSKEYSLTLFSKPNYAAAEKLWRDELKMQRGFTGNNRAYADAEFRLADVLYQRSVYLQTPIPDEVESLYKDVMRIAAKLHVDADCSSSLEHLAKVYFAQERFNEAENLFKRNITALKKKYGDEYWSARQSTFELFEMYREQKRYSDCEALLEEAIQANQRMRKAEDPFLLREMAQLRFYQGRYTEAVSLFEKTHKAMGGGLNGSRLTLSHALHRVGRDVEAEEQFKEELENRRSAKIFVDVGRWKPVPDTANYVGVSLIALGTFYIEQNRYSDAEPLLLHAVNLNKQALKTECAAWELRERIKDIRTCSTGIAKILRQRGCLRQADIILQDATAIEKKYDFPYQLNTL